MATMTVLPRRRWLPWTPDAEFQQHLRDDIAVHSAAKKTSDEILTGIDALNVSVTALSTKLGPLMPITADLGQMVGQRKFRHEMYSLASTIGHGIRKVLIWGGSTLVGLATLAAVYPPANNLLIWMLARITFGAVVVDRLPATPSIPPLPGITH